MRLGETEQTFFKQTIIELVAYGSIHLASRGPPGGHTHRHTRACTLVYPHIHKILLESSKCHKCLSITT